MSYLENGDGRLGLINLNENTETRTTRCPEAIPHHQRWIYPRRIPIRYGKFSGALHLKSRFLVVRAQVTSKWYQNKKWTPSILGLALPNKRFRRHLKAVSICRSLINSKKHIKKSRRNTHAGATMHYIRDTIQITETKTWGDFLYILKDVFCQHWSVFYRKELFSFSLTVWGFANSRVCTTSFFK